MKDFGGFAEIEFLADDGGGVDLHAVEGKLLLFRAEKFGFFGGIGEPPVGEDGKEHRHAAFENKEVAPIGEWAVGELEEAEG